MEDVDIAIVGGGMAGVSLAWFLLCDGAAQAKPLRVVLLEQEDANGYHATGRSAAEFVLNYNAPEVCALARVARRFFDAPPESFATAPLLVPRGGLMMAGPGDEERLRAEFEALAPRVPGLLWLSPEEAVARMPFLDPTAISAAWFDPEYWDIDVDQLLGGFLRQARKAGLDLRLKAALTGARRDGDTWHLETTAGDYRARVVVNAGGGWADTVAELCCVRPLGIQPLRRTAVLVDLPEGVRAADLPELNHLNDSFYFKPDGGRLLVSPADETPCEPGDVQPEELDIAWAVHHLESHTSIRVKRVDKAWAGMRSFSPDRLPVVGADPAQPGFFWLAGQGGYGILSAPALGALAASLIRNEPLPPALAEEGIAAETFAPGRFAV